MILEKVETKMVGHGRLVRLCSNYKNEFGEISGWIDDDTVMDSFSWVDETSVVVGYGIILKGTRVLHNSKVVGYEEVLDKSPIVLDRCLLSNSEILVADYAPFGEDHYPYNVVIKKSKFFDRTSLTVVISYPDIFVGGNDLVFNCLFTRAEINAVIGTCLKGIGTFDGGLF